MYMFEHTLTLPEKTNILLIRSCCRAEIVLANMWRSSSGLPAGKASHSLCYGHYGNVLWSNWSLSRNLPLLSRWSCSGFTMTVVWPNWAFQQSLPTAFHDSWPHTGPLPWMLGLLLPLVLILYSQGNVVLCKASMSCIRLHNEMLVVLPVHHFHL